MDSLLTAYRNEAGHCTSCRELGLLYKHTNGRWSYPLFHLESTFSSRILFIAEAPNFDDTFNSDKGRLTYDAETDPTGRFMRELLSSVNLRPEDVLFTNAVLCLPKKKHGKFPVMAAQRKQCLPWLKKLIDDVQPVVVATLGGEALHAVKRIEKHRLILKTDAGRLHSWYGRQLLPLYHPGLLGRVTRTAVKQMRDARSLLKFPEW